MTFYYNLIISEKKLVNLKFNVEQTVTEFDFYTIRTPVGSFRIHPSFKFPTEGINFYVSPNYYYQDIKNLSAAIPSYFTEDYVKAYKFDKTLFKKLQAEAQSKYSTNVFFDGTNDGYNPSDTRTLIPPYIQSMYYQVGMVEQAYKKSTDTPISFDYDERFY